MEYALKRCKEFSKERECLAFTALTLGIAIKTQNVNLNF